jgi:hypothetical protein
MRISAMMEELAVVLGRFGDLEVRSGNATITRMAVLPFAAIEPADNSKQPNMQQFVALLSRQDDHHVPVVTSG